MQTNECVYIAKNVYLLKQAVTIVGFPGGSDGKESTWMSEDLGSIPRLGRSPGEGHGNPL